MCCKLWQYIWEIKRFTIQSLCLFWVWLSTVDPSTSQISLFLTWVISHSWFLSLRTFSLSPLEGHDYQHLHKTFSSTRAEETFKAINICTLMNSASLANMGFLLFFFFFCYYYYYHYDVKTSCLRFLWNKYADIQPQIVKVK